MTTVTKMYCSKCNTELDPKHNRFDFIVSLHCLDLDGVGMKMTVDLCRNCKDKYVSDFISMEPTTTKEVIV